MINSNNLRLSFLNINISLSNKIKTKFNSENLKDQSFLQFDLIFKNYLENYNFLIISKLISFFL